MKAQLIGWISGGTPLAVGLLVQQERKLLYCTPDPVAEDEFRLDILSGDKFCVPPKHRILISEIEIPGEILERAAETDMWLVGLCHYGVRVMREMED